MVRALLLSLACAGCWVSPEDGAMGAEAPPPEAGSSTIWVSVFHTPHSPHWPCHLLYSAPHSPHTKAVRALAVVFAMAIDRPFIHKAGRITAALRAG